jgi:magnesium-transporting ATPase (P-type)
VLCSDATLEQEAGRWKIVGDPTEGALVVAARKAKLDEDALRETHERLDEIPFDSERQYMVTLHTATEGGCLVCVKGAPEVVARLCPAIAGQPSVLDAVNQAAHGLAERGMRVLGVASARIEALPNLEDRAWQRELRLLGLVGMVDPPREEALEAVRVCQRAGVVVKMVTGDHPATARAIGALFGLLDSEGDGAQVVSGRQIESASDRELAALADQTNVFARVAPEHKLRLVQGAPGRSGHVVAMTGDGVNDAPALAKADIGVAMGITGTAVAREASDMVLADDNFASISAAVEEGRRVYDNLLKSLAFILPTSLGRRWSSWSPCSFFPIVDGRLLMPIERGADPVDQPRSCDRARPAAGLRGP